MRPSAIIPVYALPRTIGGKLDRVASRSLSISSAISVKPHQPQLSQHEQRLRKIWMALMPGKLAQLHAIEASSDFFGVGDNSMQIMELQHKWHSELQLKIPLFELFKNSTLSSMANLIASIGRGSGPTAEE
ncbi:hypothetical protein RRF57_001409 [Xylaria bambusicola]|uniref:Carrier domain-containing protein n=1 Tax=Xylaria bambusicola TaxID=326684 RepID=A0AAN7UBU7_9PEZI